MRLLPALTALLLLLPEAEPALAQASPPPAPARKNKKPASPAAGGQSAPGGPPDAAAAPASGPATAGTGAAGANPALAQPAVDQEEFRRQVMEEVRRELQKAKDEVKQETAWVQQDSQARVQDSEAVEQLRQRVNLFQPHGYLRLRPEFFYNADLGRGPDSTGHTLFPTSFIGASNSNHSISDANIRFRFEPTLEVSEDLAIYGQMDILDNVLLGSDPVLEPYLDPFTPLSLLTRQRASSAVRVKRLWGRVNTQLGEIVFGRMGYHWGLGILHNDGNCLDCDFGDTYDRIAFAPRDFRGHKLTLMMDLLSKGQGTRGEVGELGRSVDLDTLDDGYRLAVEMVRLDTAEEARRKLEAGRWVVNYGALLDYRVQAWDTVSPSVANAGSSASLGGFVGDRLAVAQRKAKIYQPDAFISLRHGKIRLDAEIATTLGSVGTRAVREADAQDPLASQSLTFFGLGGALQADLAFLPADALLLGFELGGASADKGIYGFGARPFRNGSGPQQGSSVLPDGTPLRATGPGDIDGARFNFSDPANPHATVHAFAFNRAYNVDMLLFRNIISTVASSWYLKPSLRYRPTGRKTAGSDDTGFELYGSLMYASTWVPETAPGLQKPLGLELNVGITYDTSDRFHVGLAYGLLLPFGGLKNVGGQIPNPAGTATFIPRQDPGIAHAMRTILAIPF